MPMASKLYHCPRFRLAVSLHLIVCFRFLSWRASQSRRGMGMKRGRAFSHARWLPACSPPSAAGDDLRYELQRRIRQQHRRSWRRGERLRHRAESSRGNYHRPLRHDLRRQPDSRHDRRRLNDRHCITVCDAKRAHWWAHVGRRGESLRLAPNCQRRRHDHADGHDLDIRHRLIDAGATCLRRHWRSLRRRERRQSHRQDRPRWRRTDDVCGIHRRVRPRARRYRQRLHRRQRRRSRRGIPLSAPTSAITEPPQTSRGCSSTPPAICWSAPRTFSVSAPRSTPSLPAAAQRHLRHGFQRPDLPGKQRPASTGHLHRFLARAAFVFRRKLARA